MNNPLSLSLRTIVLTTFVLLVILLSSGHSAVFLDRVVATVNGEVITWSELRKVVEVEGARSLSGLEGEEREERAKELEKYFLNSMIDVKLQLAQARKLGFEVSDAEVTAAMMDVRKKYNLSAEEFEVSLKKEGFTLEEYRKRLAEQILLSRIVNFEVKNSILVTDSEIEEYYIESQGGNFSGRGEEVRIRQIFFAMPEDEEQKADIESKAAEVVRRLNNGENFAALAIEFSEDASREFGGDLGFVGRGTVLKEVEDVAFGLETGETSSPFWSTAGLHIIKVEERREDRAFAESRDKIRDILFQKKYNEKYDQWLKILRENAYIEVNL
jgi:peptidyl-prolyl cis-trans isomerase SurA